jgi:hypothetical protein
MICLNCNGLLLFLLQDRLDGQVNYHFAVSVSICVRSFYLSIGKIVPFDQRDDSLLNSAAKLNFP